MVHLAKFGIVVLLGNDCYQRFSIDGRRTLPQDVAIGLCHEIGNLRNGHRLAEDTKPAVSIATK